MIASVGIVLVQDFTKDEQLEISLNCTLYDFRIDHSSI